MSAQTPPAPDHHQPSTALPGVPDGWSADDAPGADAIEDLASLRRRHEEHIVGSSSVSPDSIAAVVTGFGAANYRNLLCRDEDGVVRGWASVQDRAGGRSICGVTLDPGLDDSVADPLAEALYHWSAHQAIAIAQERGLETTQLDCGAYAADEDQQRWLAAAGMRKVRTWWQMSRPVDPAEGEPGGVPDPKSGVVIRLVEGAADGLPSEADVRTVHDVLEQAFVDHFNSHEETFEEFFLRLRADPNHRWDHWWIAELIDTGSEPEPAGALIGTASHGSDGGVVGSYVEYLGVLPNARGRGVGKSLLHAIIADTARRGYCSVGLEVDADSPTGADKLYTGLGFTTGYTTQSWHRDLSVPAAG